MAGPTGGAHDVAVERLRNTAEGGMRSAAGLFVGVGDAIAGHLAPAPGPTEEQQVLEHLELPNELIAQLDPFLTEAGYTLDPTLRRIRNRQPYLVTYYHRVEVTVQGQDGKFNYVVLLYVSKKLQENYFDKYKYEVAQRIRTFDPRRGAAGVIVVFDPIVFDPILDAFNLTKWVEGQLKGCLVDLHEKGYLKCVWTDDVDELEFENSGRRVDILREWMGGNSGVQRKEARRSPLTVQDLKKSNERKSVSDDIVEILVEQVQHDDRYMEKCIRHTKWREEWKVGRIGALKGDPYDDAELLIKYAIDQGTLPADERYSAIGSLLEVMLGDLGKEDTQTLERIIHDYNLIKGYNPSTSD